MSFTKRTCNQCGWRDIQPNMKQVEIEYTAGSSKQKVTAATFLSSAGGNKTAERAVHRAITGAGTREYTRRRKVWVCTNCYSPKREIVEKFTFSKVIGWLIFLIFFVPFMHGFLQGLFG